MLTCHELYNEEFERFVREHAGTDALKLRLRYGNHTDAVTDAALNHLDCLRRCGAKFVCDGKDYAPKVFPSRLSMEQASSARVALFNASVVGDRKEVLDMTCGLGMDTAMMARRGCNVTTVELNHLHAAAARHNLAAFENVAVIEGDSVMYMTTGTRQWDVVFVDPARRGDNDSRVYNLHHCQPDLVGLMPLVSQHAPRVVAKLSPMLDVTRTLLDLPGVTAMYVVEDGGECKELLVDVTTRENVNFAPTVNVVGRSLFSFTVSEENEAKAGYGSPEAGDYLYEPSAAAMKAGPFDLLSCRFGLKALSANTHIYFGKKLVESFPGRAYRVCDVLQYSSGVIKKFARAYTEVDEVAVRNFGMSAETLRGRLKIAARPARGTSGAPTRVLGVTDYDGRRLLVMLRRI